MSENENELVDHSLYDSENRAVYIVPVPRKMVPVLNLDKGKAFRLLQTIKSSGQKPVSTWGPKGRKPIVSDAAESVGAGSGAIPKTSGKNSWTTDDVDALLDRLKARRHVFDQNQISIKFWTEIGALLNCDGEAVREKMKGLKRTYSKLKTKGTGSDHNWPYWSRMAYIIDNKQSGNMLSSAVSVEPSNNMMSSAAQVEPSNIFRSAVQVEPSSHGPSGAVSVARGFGAFSPCSGRDISSTIVRTEISQVQPSAGGATDQDVLSLMVSETEFIDENSDQNVLSRMVPETEFIGEISDQNVFSVTVPAETEFIDEISDHNVLSLMVSGTEYGALALQDISKLSETRFADCVNQNSTPEKRGDWWRSSPSKKQQALTDDTGHQIAHGKKNTPRKNTPKRKTPASSLLWPEDVTIKFLEECIKEKADVQSDKVPVRAWKTIEAAMIGKGHTYCSWKACQDKFAIMNLFFTENALPQNGIIGGSQWAFYKYFLAIHDIPQDFVYNAEVELQPDTPSKKGKKWEPEEIEMLLLLYKDRRHEFKSTKSCVRHLSIYNGIKQVMKEMGYDKSTKQCQAKMGRLFDEFRQEFDRLGTSGEGSVEFPYYNFFLEMEKGSANVSAPYVYSAGSAVNYTQEGKAVPSVPRRSRTRQTTRQPTQDQEDDDNPDDPPVPGEQKQKSKKKPVRKNLKQELLEVKRDMVTEIRLSRESQDVKNVPRVQALLSIAESINNLAQAIDSNNNAQKK